MAVPALQAFVQQTGPQTVLDGATPAIRGGRSGETIVSPLHGRYYESTYRRNVYNANYATQVTTSAGASTTFVGLAVYNPLGSSINMVLLKFGYSFLVAFGAASVVGIMTGSSTTAFPATNPITPTNQFFTSGAGGQGGSSRGCTLPSTPILNAVVAVGLTGAITTTPLVPASVYEVEGSIILPPGSFAASYTSTASGAGAFFSFTWEEVPI